MSEEETPKVCPFKFSIPLSGANKGLFQTNLWRCEEGRCMAWRNGDCHLIVDNALEENKEDF